MIFYRLDGMIGHRDLKKKEALETPYERLNRLKAEIHELNNELQELSHVFF